ncbi:hypothetical protein XA68_11095 [Ophiocordyceps unilateralis]|uniref:DUF6536 domain-containing protein n=1 Tax=Ophiocordyceps unilateralis TaxID=268505 RepID=A0A2A9PHI7_OPHUN|nr:hypothetical protein XA68_11095 [Ophiocordyceps unilateralis]
MAGLICLWALMDSLAIRRLDRSKLLLHCMPRTTRAAGKACYLRHQYEPPIKASGVANRMAEDLSIELTELDSCPPVEENRLKEPEAESFRVTQFAQRSLLSSWFPSIDDDETKSWRIWISRRSRALMLQITVVGVIMTTNMVFTIFTIVRYGSDNGIGLIFQGDCEAVKRLNQWLHLVINLLSTGMLSASNYCMQLQAAPTRANVDVAHEQGRWMDIGVPSIRNLRYLTRGRLFTWGLLALSSIPVHLIYNSAVFQSLSSSSYAVAVVKDSFLRGSPWNLTAAEARAASDPAWDDTRVSPDYINYTDIIQGLQQGATSYRRHNVSSCFEVYDDYWKPQGNAIILVGNETVQSPADDSLLMYAYIVPRWDDWGKNMWALGNSTRQFTAQSPPHPVTTWYLGPQRYQVSGCLLQDPGGIRLTCRFQYSPPIMITICTMNMVKVCVMLWSWWARSGKGPETGDNQPLYTLGDAIASFMRRPDDMTANMCLATKDDFLRRRHSRWKFWKSVAPSPETGPRLFRKEPRLWMQAASWRRWTLLMCLCTCTIAAGGPLLATALSSLGRRNMQTDFRSLLTLGFGATTPMTFLVTSLPRQDPAGLISSVLLANLPQLLVSVIYILYNAMLSTFLVQREFSLMYKREKHKPLRVSEAVGIQRSSYFISLPLRYGVPLYASSGLMHFLLSQSLFMARVTSLSPDGTVDKRASFSSCAYSPVAIITTMVAGTVLVASIVGLGFRRYDGMMRMVGTNSRAISAACHILEEDRADGYLLPVQWGVVEQTGGVGRCAFTTAPVHEVREPREGMEYR